jgi:hypothetical protein
MPAASAVSRPSGCAEGIPDCSRRPHRRWVITGSDQPTVCETASTMLGSGFIIDSNG